MFFSNKDKKNKSKSKSNDKPDIKKLIIWVFLWSAIVGASGFSLTEKGKKFWKKVGSSLKERGKDMKSFLGIGTNEMIKTIKDFLSKKN